MGLGTFLFIGIIATLLGRASLLTLRNAGPWLPLACGVAGAFVFGLLFSAVFSENAMDSVVHPIGPATAGVGAIAALFLLNQVLAAPARPARALRAPTIPTTNH